MSTASLAVLSHSYFGSGLTVPVPASPPTLVCPQRPSSHPTRVLSLLCSELSSGSILFRDALCQQALVCPKYLEAFVGSALEVSHMVDGPGSHGAANPSTGDTVAGGGKSHYLPGSTCWCGGLIKGLPASSGLCGRLMSLDQF